MPFLFRFYSFFPFFFPFFFVCVSFVRGVRVFLSWSDAVSRIGTRHHSLIFTRLLRVSEPDKRTVVHNISGHVPGG